MTTTDTATKDPHDAALGALNAGDTRALAAALLRRYRNPYRKPLEVFEEAAAHAAEMSARSLSRTPGPRDVTAARIYADTWSLLADREMRGLLRRQRDRARAALAKGGAR